MPIAVGVWTTIAVAAVVVCVKRWAFGWEPAWSLGERLLLGSALLTVSILAFRLARSRTPVVCSLVTVAPPVLLVVGLVPWAHGLEFAAWSLFGALLGIGLGRPRGANRCEFVEPGGPAEPVDLVESTAPTLAIAALSEFDGDVEPELDEGDTGVAPTHATERFVDDAGETISGRALVRFEPGQRLATVHVPFTPAFARPPHCEAEVEEVDATVKPTTTRTYGARFEVRRSNVEAATEVRLAWSAWLAFAADAA